MNRIWKSPCSRAVVLCLFVASVMSANAYTDFNVAISTFNSQINSWNAGPLGRIVFNDDVATFNIAVNTFNLATGGTYLTAGSVGTYPVVLTYPTGGTPPPDASSITAFNVAVNSYDSAAANFNSGLLSRPDFNNAIASFNSAVTVFDAAGANPPVSQLALVPLYVLQEPVTDPGTSGVPEPGTRGLIACGLMGAAVVRCRKRE